PSIYTPSLHDALPICQAVLTMFVSGAIAGLVGAIVVLGSQFRFIDGALLTPAYTWSGLMAALLAGGEPAGAVVAGFFFAALQTGDRKSTRLNSSHDQI